MGAHIAWRMPVLLGGILATMALGGCASGLGTGALRHYAATGDCGAITRAITDHPEGYGTGSQLLFAMDSAMALMYCGDFEGAQRFFREADRLGEALWTESVTLQAASLLTGDYVLKYPGEDYERVMVNLMSALGFIRAGDLEGALVEMRRLDSLLTLYNSRYESKNVYTEDAFARYLSGILNEDYGDDSAAFIDYLRAARVYKDDYDHNYGTRVPASLREDLFRLAGRVGRKEDALAVFPSAPKGDTRANWQAAGVGRLVYVQLIGDAPRKVSGSVIIPTGSGPMAIAFPRMVISPPACGGGRLTLSAGGDPVTVEAALVEDVNRIAAKNLSDRQVRVMAKTIARVVAKQAAIHGIANSSDDPKTQANIRAALNIVNLFFERADTRSWQTLPGEIHMARVFLPPGSYRVQVEGCGQVRELAPVEVAAGKTRYVVDDARYPGAAPPRPPGAL